MNFDFLNFLMRPEFILFWYGTGILFSVWNIYHVMYKNKDLHFALKLAWPIIFIFFSFFAWLLYLWTCGGKDEIPMYRRSINAAIHCVAGDGIGIMTAMVISRIINLEFWSEFWFEYAVGFASGWFVFQYIAMKQMNDSKLAALLKAGRAEFFSMITVMLGMGLVMRYVTPAVVGHPPDPHTAAFWGFGALGLLVGFVFTYPMNYWMIRIGWKHGKCR